MFVTAPSDRSSRDSVYLWPWRVAEDALLRNSPTAAEVPRLVVSYLIFSHNLVELEKVRVCIFRNPLIRDDDQSFSVRVESLSSEQQIQLFIASRVRPRPCLSYAVSASVA